MGSHNFRYSIKVFLRSASTDGYKWSYVRIPTWEFCDLCSRVVFMQACDTLLLGKNGSQLECSSSIHVCCNYWYSCPCLFRVVERVSTVQRYLGPGLERRTFRSDQYVLKVQ